MKIRYGLKRIVDVTLAAVGLVVAAPVMGVIALAIRLEGAGRVIFRQERLGLGGKRFTLYKFRKFPDVNGDIGPGLTMSKDLRMSRLGEFLERFKLDELPQLWNILKGDMSFVGPRPESARYEDLLTGEYKRVLDYLPGIFGPNQIAFRNESQMYPPDRDPEEYYRNVLFPEKIEADLEYGARATLLGDFFWIIRGVWTVVYGGVDWRRVFGLHGRIVLVDIAAVLFAWILANVLRFGSLPDDWKLDVVVTGCWLMPAVVVPLMMVGGCYRHPVRLFALVDAMRLVVVAAVAWGLAYLVLLGLFHRHASAMLAPLGVLLLVPMILAPRVWWREKWLKSHRRPVGSKWKKLVIYGAGRRGSSLVSLLEQGFPKAEILGYVDDDDATMLGRVIQGRKVLGSERDLNTIHGLKRIDQIWVTFTPDEHKFKRLSAWCEQNGVELIVLPISQPFSSLIFDDETTPVSSVSREKKA